LVGVILFSLFTGGLAYSIWDNTDSIAFPIIVVLVLVMAYAGFIQELRHGSDHT
jgi:hypothetical protein